LGAKKGHYCYGEIKAAQHTTTYQGRYGIREMQSLYIDHFGVKKRKIDPENTCFLDLN